MTIIYTPVGDEQTNLEATSRYLHELYPKGLKGDLVFCRPKVDTDGWTRISIVECENCNLDEIAKRVHGKKQVYLKVNTMDGMSISARGMNAIGGLSEIVEIVGFFADIDADKRDCYPTRSAALEMLNGLPIPPSMIVGSGGPLQGGLHPYWILETPIVVTPGNLQGLKELSRRIQAYLDDKLKQICKDFRSDELHNLDRVLRVPGSIRQDGVPVALLEVTDRRYTLEDFERVSPPLETKRYHHTNTRIESDSGSCPITRYLSDSGRTFEDWVSSFGWKFIRFSGGQNHWQRPAAGPGASPVSAKQGFSKNGRPGFQNFSGSADIAQDWHSLESLFVHYRFNDDWTAAAKWCHEQIDQAETYSASGAPVNLDSILTSFETETPKTTISVDITPKIPEKTEVMALSKDNVFHEFPVDKLPEAVREFVVSGSQAIGCDSSLIALPTLTLLAGTIGLSRKLEISATWKEPCTLWTACIGESGTSKTPAFKFATAPFQKIQKEWMHENESANSQYGTDKAIYERDLAEWKKDRKTNEPPPTPPDPPRQRRNIISDVTMEALLSLLKDNPRGLIAVHDELSGWLGSFDKYTNAKGSDAAHWLSLWNGGSVTVDRKHGIPKTLFVPEGTVSVTGGIQPNILRDMLGEKHIDNGLSSRLLMSYPPRVAKRWRESTFEQKTVDRMNDIAKSLSEMSVNSSDFADSISIVLTLSREAKELFKAFYIEHNRKQAELHGPLCNAWSKFECYPVRIALVHHLVRVADRDKTLEATEVVDAKSMADAIGMVEWFKRETSRIHLEIGVTAEQKEELAILKRLREQGEQTIRDLYRGCRSKFENADQVEHVVLRLVSSGRVKSIDIPPGPQGGQPTKRYKSIV